MEHDPRADRPLTSSEAGPRAESNQPFVALHRISKSFGATAALTDVSLSVKRGSIHALLGENGAGKTTLMRIAFGLVQPDSGWIELNGKKASFANPSEAISAGIGMVHQQFSLVPAMSVAENIALGGTGPYSFKAVAARMSDLGVRTNLRLDPAARVSALGSADRQKLEIMRALIHGAGMMILDEPTAVLTPADTYELFEQLDSYARGGGTVVLITHKLDDAIRHADEVTVLRQGRVVLHSPMRDASATRLSDAMLGVRENESRAISPAPALSGRTVVAELADVALPDRLGRAGAVPITLKVLGGEVVGIAALDGAAASLLRVLAGRIAPAYGTMTIPSQIAFVPENRKEAALIDDFSLVENFALKASGDRSGVMDWRGFGRDTEATMAEFDVRASSANAKPASLSGGNQQRFILGRELHDAPTLLVLENPTQGLDVGATSFVHARIRAARDRGAGVVFYSTDLDELASLSDRVFVTRDHTLVEISPEREAIGQALLATGDHAR